MNKPDNWSRGGYVVGWQLCIYADPVMHMYHFCTRVLMPFHSWYTIMVYFGVSGKPQRSPELVWSIISVADQVVIDTIKLLCDVGKLALLLCFCSTNSVCCHLHMAMDVL